MCIFNFNLLPLEEIAKEDRESTFYLSDGCFYLKFNDEPIFEYSEYAKNLGYPTKYANYYLLRVVEDIIELLPRVSQQIPASLNRLIIDQEGPFNLIETLSNLEEEICSDISIRKYENATQWLQDRRLQFSYLRHPQSIILLREGDLIHCWWDTPDENLEEEKSLWSNPKGYATLRWDNLSKQFDVASKNLLREIEERKSHSSIKINSEQTTGNHLKKNELEKADDFKQIIEAIEWLLNP